MRRGCSDRKLPFHCACLLIRPRQTLASARKNNQYNHIKTLTVWRAIFAEVAVCLVEAPCRARKDHTDENLWRRP